MVRALDGEQLRLRDYLFLQPSFAAVGSIDAFGVSIEWDENQPGMVLALKSEGSSARTILGVLSIPHERSPLIYIQAAEMPSSGRTIIVSTMLGEPAMRGLMLTVTNPVANAWTPLALPVMLRRLRDGEELKPSEIGTINSPHPKFTAYRNALLSG